MARMVIVSMTLVLVGFAALQGAALPASAASPAGQPAAADQAPATGTMPAEIRAFLDAHPVPMQAVRQAESKLLAQRAADAANAADVQRVDRSELDVASDHGLRADGASARTDAADQLYTTVIDDFEGSVLDPNLWTVSDLDGELYGEYYWGLSKCRASQGTQSLWSVGGGKDGSQLGCDDLYPSGSNGSAMLAMDMSKFTTPPSQLDFLVDYWLNTRIFDEAGVVPDGLFISWLRPLENGTVERIVLKGITSQYPDRFFNEPMRFDLVQASEIYEPFRTFDLSKEPVLLMEFLFMSRDAIPNEPPPTTFVGGVFIDNIRLVSDVQPSIAKAPAARQPARHILPRHYQD
jgi:hypothetical protein